MTPVTSLHPAPGLACSWPECFNSLPKPVADIMHNWSPVFLLDPSNWGGGTCWCSKIEAITTWSLSSLLHPPTAVANPRSLIAYVWMFSTHGPKRNFKDRFFGKTFTWDLMLSTERHWVFLYSVRECKQIHRLSPGGLMVFLSDLVWPMVLFIQFSFTTWLLQMTKN